MNGVLGKRGLLAVVLGLGVLAGLARGQTPPAQPTTGYIVEECAECERGYGAQGDGSAPENKQVHGGLFRKKKAEPKLNAYGRPKVQRGDEKEKVTLGNRRPDKPCLCCYSHINDYTVGSLKTDGFFIFGSSRWFFGEKCLKGPPPMLPFLDKAPVTAADPIRR